jgi:hypothetical protein
MFYPNRVHKVRSLALILNQMNIVQFLQRKPNKMRRYIKMLLFLILNEAQHVSGDTPSIIRSLKLHKQPLDLHTWKVVGRAVVGQRPSTP